MQGDLTSKWLISAALALGLSFAAAAEPPSRRISRAEVLKRGLEKNLELLGKRLERRKADASQRSAGRAYSPTLFADLGYGDAYLADPDTPGQSRHVDYSVGASWRTPVGTALSAQLGADQSVFDSSWTHGASVSVGVTQPLLKDGWLDGASLPLREARFNAAIQHQTWKTDLNRLLLDLETAYWDLALAQSDVELKSRSLDRARAQYEDTKENIRRGILAESEIYLVEENVVIFDQELARAKLALTVARRRLAEFLLLDPSLPLDAEDVLASSALSLPERAAFVEAGVKANPRVIGQRLRADLANARVRYQLNQALPSLSLGGSLALRGWDSVYSTAWGQVFSSPEPDARFGVSFSLALDRAAVQAELEAAQLEAERQGTLLLKEETAVRFEVENAWTDLETNQGLLALAKRQVELAELKLKAQNEKYSSGLSTLADVVRFQRDLDNAVGAFQRVMRSVKVGHVKLLSSQGSLADTVKDEER